jgi:hypothetical protein
MFWRVYLVEGLFGGGVYLVALCFYVEDYCMCTY